MRITCVELSHANSLFKIEDLFMIKQGKTPEILGQKYARRGKKQCATTQSSVQKVKMREGLRKI